MSFMILNLRNRSSFW